MSVLLMPKALDYIFWFCDCKLLHSLHWSLNEISLSVLKLLHSAVIQHSSHRDYILTGIISLRHVLVHPVGTKGFLPRKIYKVLSTGASDKVGHKQVLQDFAEPGSAPVDVLVFPPCLCMCPYSMHWGKWPNLFYLTLFPRVICLN